MGVAFVGLERTANPNLSTERKGKATGGGFRNGSGRVLVEEVPVVAERPLVVAPSSDCLIFLGGWEG